MARKTTKAPRRTKVPAASNPRKKAPAAATPDIVVPPARKIAEIRNRWPALTEVQRAAYLSQLSDAVCEKRGAETRGAGVRAEAAAWIVQMDETMRGPDKDSLVYAPHRFRFFIECVDELTAALAAQNAERNRAQSDKTLLADRLAEAEVADGALEEALDRAAGQREAERRDLDTASAAASTPEERVLRTRRLVTLAREWLGSEDPLLQVLVRDAALTAQVVDAAEAAAAALDDARTGARATRIDPRDKPAVNRAEGRVTYEMEFAQARWDEANARNKRVRRLIPGASTRGVLGRSKPKADKGKKEKDPKGGGEGGTPS